MELVGLQVPQGVCLFWFLPKDVVLRRRETGKLESQETVAEVGSSERRMAEDDRGSIIYLDPPKYTRKWDMTL